MISFFILPNRDVVAVQSSVLFEDKDIAAISWLLGGAVMGHPQDSRYIGPRREMITPWSTTAVEITQNMNLNGIRRMEIFRPAPEDDAAYDPMLQQLYPVLDEKVFEVDRLPEPIKHIENLRTYNTEEGLALNEAEISYLEGLAKRLGRPLTDSEVFGFSQVNSEHCRHKIFNGQFIIDGEPKPASLFKLIKKTSAENPGLIVSAYKDNCAFLRGPKDNLYFAPEASDRPSSYTLTQADTVLSLKAETHNFPTTVEPFNGAATGSGGEIRDRMAGGKGSYPLAGTAVYMTAYARFGDPEKRPWEAIPSRPWLYQSPEEILTKASNGASDFGNKFGQPLICGSLLCFEHQEGTDIIAYDKVIMQAGGLGYAKMKDAAKDKPAKGDVMVLLGGDNYRIGMGGGAVSSVATGEYRSAIELNAVQRSNPEMQKRVFNALRALVDSPRNPIVSIHDHGAGGHLNCLSELVEDTGGTIDMSQLPVGDPTLSAKEIVGNESQERMGLVLHPEDVDWMRRTALRERAPMYEIGKVTGDMRFTFENAAEGEKPIDLELKDMFGSAPKTVMEDDHVTRRYAALPPTRELADEALYEAVLRVLRLESVACKDWLTNKVDRCVTGLIAKQQCVGPLHLPLSDYGMTAVSYHPAADGTWPGMATSLGHNPVAGLVNAAAGSRMAIAEALTNLVFAPLDGGLKAVSLSANWMWPCRNAGEDARLYDAVQAASDFACALGINIPTGKDSLSLTQKYPDGRKVLAPGTVIISALAPVKDIRRAPTPVLADAPESCLVYIPFSTDSWTLDATAFAQSCSRIGNRCADVTDPAYFAAAFGLVQLWVAAGIPLAGHDVSAGGLITCLAEMCFSNVKGGLRIDRDALLTATGEGTDLATALMAENPGVVLQVLPQQLARLTEDARSAGVAIFCIATVSDQRAIKIGSLSWDLDAMRQAWFSTSYELDKRQTAEDLASKRLENLGKLPLQYQFPAGFDGKIPVHDGKRPQAAVIREKGSNSEREMAWMLYLAGFDVRDVHMTDLASGREDLHDVQCIVFVGGFANADVLGSAKGWAGAFMYNPKAKAALEAFYAREDTLSLGICNGCQLMAELGLITPRQPSSSPKMKRNLSQKFECGFVNITISPSVSIMLKPLEGSRLGIWAAHGEGQFSFPLPLSHYHVAARYSYDTYPANPNGSPEGIAAVCSPDGRHLAMMPHPERCIYPWNWAHYPAQQMSDEVSPWLLMFTAAADFCRR